MIRHIVMFSAKSPENIELIYRGLKNLEKIEGNWFLRVSKNEKLDQIANDIDIVVYGEFPDIKALEQYKSHEIYKDTITIVRPLRDKRIAVDIKE